MPDCSPAKWHLAHTTWFFETFVLRKRSGYRPFDATGAYEYLFNSYYNQVGPQFRRPDRGLLSRPTVAEVYEYRQYVDERLLRLLEEEEASGEAAAVITLGIHHEQQHQELILTDLKYAWSLLPSRLRPVYRDRRDTPGGDAARMNWAGYPEGVRCIGHGGADFAFDNEGPRHRVLVAAFQLADRPVTNGEYLAFLEDRGYQRPELWLSDGWSSVQQQGWRAPLYWEPGEGGWWMMTLCGARPVDPNEPVCHVSFFEADAYARWAGARLPAEAEWEIAAGEVPIRGNFVEDGYFHPIAPRQDSPAEMFGDVWEWTSSPYLAYPGYRPPDGALGEYNAKFMNGQYVLRGGSCFTPRSHIRPTYRNFFPPDKRWQCTGIRLVR
jgi:ergothioneine biosynthesis protein EgtB